MFRFAYNNIFLTVCS